MWAATSPSAPDLATLSAAQPDLEAVMLAVPMYGCASRFDLGPLATKASQDRLFS
jgi:hypothetical protein